MTYLTAPVIAPKYAAEDLTFGVEIETMLPVNAPISVGSYYTGNRVPGTETSENSAWTAKFDGSIQPRRGFTGCEFVSPVLRGAAGLKNVKQTIKVARGLGAQVNASCGVHVHVGVPADLNCEDRARFIKALTFLVGKVERGIYAATGTPRRERGRWCKGVKAIARAQGWNTSTIATGLIARDRYHGLNITNLTGHGHRHQTIEFRYFSESLNSDKIVAWTALCVALVQLALTSPKLAKPDVNYAKARTLIGSGQGERELNRLFYTIGWTKGKCRYFGLGDFHGFKITKFKKTLREMARKYDTN